MLELLDLQALAKTDAGVQFIEAIRAIEKSFIEEGDVTGARSVTIKCSFKRAETGNGIITDAMVSTSTPNRSTKSMARISPEGKLEIDTNSGDVFQPFLGDVTEGELASPFEKDGQ